MNRGRLSTPLDPHKEILVLRGFLLPNRNTRAGHAAHGFRYASGSAAHVRRLTIRLICRLTGADTNRELTYFYHKDEFIRVVTLHPRSNLHIQSLYDSNEVSKMHPMDLEYYVSGSAAHEGRLTVKF